jgi:hypothetical protein
LDPVGWFVTVTAIGRHNIFSLYATRYEKPSIVPDSLSPARNRFLGPGLAGTNPAREALTHRGGGRECNRLNPPFPPYIIHAICPFFFSLNVAGHVWASASPRIQTRRSWTDVNRTRRRWLKNQLKYAVRTSLAILVEIHVSVVGLVKNNLKNKR